MPLQILFRGIEKENWISKDMGKTYTPLSNAHKFDEVKMHPRQASWILATAMAPECSKGEGGDGTTPVYVATCLLFFVFFVVLL